MENSIQQLNKNPKKQPQKFIQAFFSAGITKTPLPIDPLKKMTHVIEDFFILKGKNIDSTLTKIPLKKTRIIHLSDDYSLLIRYQTTLKNFSNRPIWDFSIKNFEEIEDSEKNGENWKIVKIFEIEDFLNKNFFEKSDFFSSFNLEDVTKDDSLNVIFEVFGGEKSKKKNLIRNMMKLRSMRYICNA